MFFVQPLLSCISIALVLLLIGVIAWRAPPNDWGDVTQALMYHQVRKYLLRLDIRKEHKKYWRPQILLFVSDPVNSVGLIEFANNLKKGGLFMIASVLEGTPAELGNLVRPLTIQWLDFISLAKIKGFPEINIAPVVRDGMESLLLTAGIGQMKPNTIIVGFHHRLDAEEGMRANTVSMGSQFAPVDPAEKVREIFKDYPRSRDMSSQDYVQFIRQCISYEKNICVARYFATLNRKTIVEYRGAIPTYFNRKQRFTIDMWPIILPDRYNYTYSSELLLMMGHITKQTDIWAKYSKLRVKGVARNENEVEFVRGFLENLVSNVRIKSRVEVITLNDHHHLLREAVDQHGLAPDYSNFDELASSLRYSLLNQIIAAESETTCSLFLPLPPIPVSPEHADSYLADLTLLTEGLPPVMLVHGSQSIVCSEL